MEETTNSCASHETQSGASRPRSKLSLSSPTFQELGPDARDLLGVVAFFPQGVDENNLDWLFPTISDGTNIFDTFCILSLTYRSNGFMSRCWRRSGTTSIPKTLGHLPSSARLKEHYFRRLSVEIYPDKPGFDETRWIMHQRM
jgi:hypothetical protein